MKEDNLVYTFMQLEILWNEKKKTLKLARVLEFRWVAQRMGWKPKKRDRIKTMKKLAILV